MASKNSDSIKGGSKEYNTRGKLEQSLKSQRVFMIDQKNAKDKSRDPKSFTSREDKREHIPGNKISSSNQNQNQI